MHDILPFLSSTVGTFKKPDFAAAAILIPGSGRVDDCSLVLFDVSFTSGTLRNPLAAAAAIEFGLSSNPAVITSDQNIAKLNN